MEFSLNWALLCTKKNRKTYENAVKKPEKLLTTITQITEDTYREVLYQYNPHGVIIADFDTEIAFNFREKRDGLKIIFLIDITLANEEIIEKLLQNDIIVADKLNFGTLPTADEVRLQLEELHKKKLEEEQQAQEEKAHIEGNIRYIKVNLEKEELENDHYNKNRIHFLTEEDFGTQDNKKVFIGISELQHHIGCTHISFEIAEFLFQKGKNACVLISDPETYNSLVKYHNINDKENIGFRIDKLVIYPYSQIEHATKEHQYIICDFGFLREELKSDFAETSVKIMLVSGANWDLHVITDYLNVANDVFKTTTNYLFYPLNQTRFIQINRQFQRENLHAYRIQTSLDYNTPCKENKEVYAKILGLKSSKSKKKRQK